jgi:hypothetical protein
MMSSRIESRFANAAACTKTKSKSKLCGVDSNCAVQSLIFSIAFCADCAHHPKIGSGNRTWILDNRKSDQDQESIALGLALAF